MESEAAGTENERDLSLLERSYEAIQARFKISEGSKELAQAVQFASNSSKPIHRWLRFKEGFSADLLSALPLELDQLNSTEALFLDPFLGCGTTLLAADLQHGWPARRVGVEVNPFLSFVARTKTRWRDYDPDRFHSLSEGLLEQPLSRELPASEWPSLSTFRNEELFAPETISALVDAVGRVEEITGPERDPLLLGVAVAAERLGFYRKDGRALRILRSEGEVTERRQRSIEDTIRETWRLFETDLRELEGKRRVSVGNCLVMTGDGRRVGIPADPLIREGDVTCCAYSPPYLNHIDYTEVYKVELWLLNFVKTQREMLDLRKRTFRSHASVGVDETVDELPDDVCEAVEQAAELVTRSGSNWHRPFRSLALAYLADVRQALQRQYQLLSPGGLSICVIGNSAHGSKQERIPVATDLLISRLGESIGFSLERILVARQLRRRDHLNRFLRESVVIMRRPSAQ
jgi:SAM-dependent methyltransferase